MFCRCVFPEFTGSPDCRAVTGDLFRKVGTSCGGKIEGRVMRIGVGTTFGPSDDPICCLLESTPTNI